MNFVQVHCVTEPTQGNQYLNPVADNWVVRLTIEILKAELQPPFKLHTPLHGSKSQTVYLSQKGYAKKARFLVLRLKQGHINNMMGAPTTYRPMENGQGETMKVLSDCLIGHNVEYR